MFCLIDTCLLMSKLFVSVCINMYHQEMSNKLLNSLRKAITITKTCCARLLPEELLPWNTDWKDVVKNWSTLGTQC